MKLYKLTQNDCKGYDTYSAMLVSAENEEEAKRFHPFSFGRNIDNIDFWGNWGWAKRVENVITEYLGNCKPEEISRIIMVSFNKG